jgi:hypothetical protein
MEAKKVLLKAILALLILFIFPPNSHPWSITLAWDPNTETDLASYNLYRGSATHTYSTIINVGKATSYTVSNLGDGTYFFSLTALNTKGLESGFSNEVSKAFISSYSLGITKNGTGTGMVTSSPSGINCGSTCTYSFTAGTVATLTATASSGSSFTSWSGSNCTGNGTCVFSLNGNATVTATFSPAQTYTLTASAGTGGSVSPSGNKIVNPGASQTYLITPLAGYKISDLLVDNVSVGVPTSYTFSNVTANHTISAKFAVSTSTYTLTASAGFGGTISPTGNKTVNYGASQTYAITASTGYRISDILIDNVSVGAVASYTFTNVTANRSIIAYFVPTSWTTDCRIMAPVEIVADYGSTGSFKIRLNYSTLPSNSTKFVKGQSYPNGPWIEYTPNAQGEITLQWNYGEYFEFSYGVRVSSTEYWISPACSRYVYPVSAPADQQHFRVQLGTTRTCSKNISDTLIKGVEKLTNGKYRIYLNFMVLPLVNYQKLFVQGQSAPNSAWIEYPVTYSNPCFSFDVSWPTGGGPIHFSFGVVKSNGVQQWIDPTTSSFLCTDHLCIDPTKY